MNAAFYVRICNLDPNNIILETLAVVAIILFIERDLNSTIISSQADSSQADRCSIQALDSSL